jgi:preprotein translocase subunit YajC
MHVSSYIVAASSSSGGAAIVQLGIFMLIPVAMYFLLIRPQRRRQREAVELQRAVEVGDEVMTTSGMYGFITGFDGDIAWLEVDDNVQIRIARAAIQRRVDTAVGDTALPSDDGTKSRHAKADQAAPIADDESTK